MLELDPALRARASASGVGGVGRLLVGVEQLEDPLGRGDARLQHVDHRRQLGERLGELARVLDERLDVADASSRPTATRSPPTTAMATKFRLPRNIIAGWMMPEMNCAPKLAS